jgi:DNA-binding transcriptional MocR family regulator
MATAGCSQGLTWLCTQFTDPGDTIFVEEATYYLAIDSFRNFQERS